MSASQALSAATQPERRRQSRPIRVGPRQDRDASGECRGPARRRAHGCRRPGATAPGGRRASRRRAGRPSPSPARSRPRRSRRRRRRRMPKPPSRNAWTACSWAVASARVRPETCAAQEASCMAVAHGRCSARPSSTAARQAARPASSRPRTAASSVGEVVGRRSEVRADGGGRHEALVDGAGERRGQLAPDQRGEDLGGPVPDGRVGQDVGGLVADLGSPGRPCRRARGPGRPRGAAARAWGRRRSCRARAGRRGRRPGSPASDTLRTVGTAAASSRARRARTASTPRCSRSRPRPGCMPATEARVVGVRGEPGQQHVGHRPPGREPDEVEAQGGGTDQRVRHSALPPGKRIGRGLRPVRPC